MKRELGTFLFAGLALLIAAVCFLYLNAPANGPIPYWESLVNKALQYLP